MPKEYPGESMTPLTGAEKEALKTRVKGIVDEVEKKEWFIKEGPKYFNELCYNAVQSDKSLSGNVSSRRFGMLVSRCRTEMAKEYRSRGLDKEKNIAVSPVGDIHYRAERKTDDVAVPSLFTKEEMERMRFGARRQSEIEARRMGRSAAQEAGYLSPADED